MYKILGLKSQDFVQNSTNYMGGKSREIVKIFGAKLSRYREIITTGRGRSFDQTSFDEGCKLRLVFWLVETQNQDTIKFSSIPV